jgi:hypothetical protein
MKLRKTEKGMRLDIPVYMHQNGMVTVSGVAIGAGPNARACAIRMAAQFLEQAFDNFDKRRED